MTDIALPIQTLEELDIAAEKFEQLVEDGLRLAVGEVLSREDIEEALAAADQAALDQITVLWAAYVGAELTPTLDLSMIAASSEMVARLMTATENPLVLLADQQFDTTAYLEQAANRLVGIGDELWLNARASLAEGVAAGESVPKLAARIRDAAGVTTPRARVIARTESHGARNVAAMQAMSGFEQAYGIGPGVMRKRWQATGSPPDGDGRTRPTHVAADGQEVAFSQPYSVGGASLAFPGDPTGPPQETIQCRCSNLAIFDPADLNLEGDPGMPSGPVITAAVRREGFLDLPVAALAREWDGPAAAQRLAADCGVEEADAGADAWACYANGFLWRDDDADPETKAAYKLGIVDLVDGERTLIPRGVYAVAGVLQGARGGADIPEADQDELRSVVSGLYERINEETGNDRRPPWDTGSSAASTPVTAALTGGETVPWSGVLVVEGQRAGDGRVFAPGSLTWPEVGATESLEIALGWEYERAHGVGESKTVQVGRIDRIERQGNQIIGSGVIDLGSSDGREAARRMGSRDNPGFLAGTSIIADDPENSEVEFVLPEGCEDGAVDDARCMVPETTVYHSGRIRAADLVDIPAYVEARLYLDADESAIPDDIPTEDKAPIEEPVVASAYTITIPEIPPAEWFSEPTEQPDIGAITVTDDGRVFGYLAPKHVAHRSYRSKRMEVPTKNVDYGVWMNRATIVAGSDGFERIATGPITMGCGHAPANPRMIGAARQAHYDNSCSVAATARVGENARGVWIAGALLPGITPRQVREMMACQLSGDWGPHRERPGRRELEAALLVPVPGLPVEQRSFSLSGGELARTVTPIRFGTTAGGMTEAVGQAAAVEAMAAQIGRDRESRLREFAAAIRG